MAQRQSNMREALLRAGIQEINEHGVHNFSIRRVAEACKVSCAAPYKHFRDKREFIAGVIEYVNEQWAERQREILHSCGETLREQIVEVSVGYVKFLMEKPYYRSILMLKDAEYDNIYHRTRGEMSSRSQQLEKDIFATGQWSGDVFKRKLHLIRSLIFGTIFLYDTGEIPYNEVSLGELRYNINREFDLP